MGLAILAIVLFVIFAPKGASDSLLGYWEAEEIDFGNGRFVDEYLGHDVSGTMGLEISSDGSMSLGSAYNTKIIEGRWERTSSGISATLNGETVYVALSGDDLVLLDGDMAIIFSRSQRDINNPTVPFGSLSGSEEAPLLPDGEHSHEGESANTAVAGSGDVANGMFHVSVVGAEKITDVNDRQGIRIYYEFTNNFDYSVSAWNVLNFEAVQDGKALRSTYTWDDSEAEYYNHDRAIRPGVTILCFAEYSANLSGGSIDFSVFGWDEGKNGGTVTATYSPDALPGRPAAYVIKPIEDPQWTLSLPESGTLDEQFSVSVGDADLITDAYGDSAIRVFYTFKNGSSAPICLTRALYCHSYQDGIELDETYALDETETDAQAYQDIAPGETAACSVVFKLRNSTSPVEAEIEAAQTYDAVGQTYSIA